MKNVRMVISVLLAAGVACESTPRTAAIQEIEGCRISQDGSISGTLHDVCAHLAERWRVLAGTKPPRGEIRVVERNGFAGGSTDAGWLLLWPKPPDGRTENAHFLENIMPHEAAHALVKEGAPALPRERAAYTYGSIAPDWFDEAAAIWGESERLRVQRIARIRDSKPSLAALLTAPHPGIDFNSTTAQEYQVVERTTTPPCGARCTWLADSLRDRFHRTDVRVYADGRSDTVNTWHTTDPNGSNRFEDREFYPLAYSLLAFINERGGPDAFHALVARYAADPTPRADALNGLPGLPDSFEEIERAWHAFLATPR